MTDVDELLSRLKNLPSIPLDSDFKAALGQRARRRVQKRVRRAPFASIAVLGTVIAYMTWALHFTSALYP